MLEYILKIFIAHKLMIMWDCITKTIIGMLFLLIHPVYCNSIASKAGCSIHSMGSSLIDSRTTCKLYGSTKAVFDNNEVGVKGYCCWDGDRNQRNGSFVRSSGLNCFIGVGELTLGGNLYYGEDFVFYGAYIDTKGPFFGYEGLFRLHYGVWTKFIIEGLTHRIDSHMPQVGRNDSKVHNCHQITMEATLKFCNLYIKNSGALSISCNEDSLSYKGISLYGLCILGANLFRHLTLECGGMVYLNNSKVDFNVLFCVGISTNVVDDIDHQISDRESVEDMILYQDLWHSQLAHIIQEGDLVEDMPIVLLDSIDNVIPDSWITDIDMLMDIEDSKFLTLGLEDVDRCNAMLSKLLKNKNQKYKVCISGDQKKIELKSPITWDVTAIECLKIKDVTFIITEEGSSKLLSIIGQDNLIAEGSWTKIEDAPKLILENVVSSNGESLYIDCSNIPILFKANRELSYHVFKNISLVLFVDLCNEGLFSNGCIFNTEIFGGVLTQKALDMWSQMWFVGDLLIDKDVHIYKNCFLGGYYDRKPFVYNIDMIGDIIVHSNNILLVHNTSIHQEDVNSKGFVLESLAKLFVQDKVSAITELSITVHGAGARAYLPKGFVLCGVSSYEEIEGARQSSLKNIFVMVNDIVFLPLNLHKNEVMILCSGGLKYAAAKSVVSLGCADDTEIVLSVYSNDFVNGYFYTDNSPLFNLESNSCLQLYNYSWIGNAKWTLVQVDTGVMNSSIYLGDNILYIGEANICVTKTTSILKIPNKQVAFVVGEKFDFVSLLPETHWKYVFIGIGGNTLSFSMSGAWPGKQDLMFCGSTKALQSVQQLYSIRSIPSFYECAIDEVYISGEAEILEFITVKFIDVPKVLVDNSFKSKEYGTPDCMTVPKLYIDFGRSQVRGNIHINGLLEGCILTVNEGYYITDKFFMDSRSLKKKHVLAIPGRCINIHDVIEPTCLCISQIYNKTLLSDDGKLQVFFNLPQDIEGIDYIRLPSEIALYKGVTMKVEGNIMSENPIKFLLKGNTSECITLDVMKAHFVNQAKIYWSGVVHLILDTSQIMTFCTRQNLQEFFNRRVRGDIPLVCICTQDIVLQEAIQIERLVPPQITWQSIRSAISTSSDITHIGPLLSLIDLLPVNHSNIVCENGFLHIRASNISMYILDINILDKQKQRHTSVYNFGYGNKIWLPNNGVEQVTIYNYGGIQIVKLRSSIVAVHDSVYNFSDRFVSEQLVLSGQVDFSVIHHVKKDLSIYSATNTNNFYLEEDQVTIYFPKVLPVSVSSYNPQVFIMDNSNINIYGNITICLERDDQVFINGSSRGANTILIKGDINMQSDSSVVLTTWPVFMKVYNSTLISMDRKYSIAADQPNIINSCDCNCNNTLKILAGQDYNVDETWFGNVLLSNNPTETLVNRETGSKLLITNSNPLSIIDIPQMCYKWDQCLYKHCHTFKTSEIKWENHVGEKIKFSEAFIRNVVLDFTHIVWDSKMKLFLPLLSGEVFLGQKDDICVNETGSMISGSINYKNIVIHGDLFVDDSLIISKEAHIYADGHDIDTNKGVVCVLPQNMLSSGNGSSRIIYTNRMGKTTPLFLIKDTGALIIHDVELPSGILFSSFYTSENQKGGLIDIRKARFIPDMCYQGDVHNMTSVHFPGPDDTKACVATSVNNDEEFLSAINKYSDVFVSNKINMVHITRPVLLKGHVNIYGNSAKFYIANSYLELYDRKEEAPLKIAVELPTDEYMIICRKDITDPMEITEIVFKDVVISCIKTLNFIYANVPITVSLHNVKFLSKDVFCTISSSERKCYSKFVFDPHVYKCNDLTCNNVQVFDNVWPGGIIAPDTCILSSPNILPTTTFIEGNLFICSPSCVLTSNEEPSHKLYITYVSAPLHSIQREESSSLSEDTTREFIFICAKDSNIVVNNLPFINLGLNHICKFADLSLGGTIQLLDDNNITKDTVLLCKISTSNTKLIDYKNHTYIQVVDNLDLKELSEALQNYVSEPWDKINIVTNRLTLSDCDCSDNIYIYGDIGKYKPENKSVFVLDTGEYNSSGEIIVPTTGEVSISMCNNAKLSIEEFCSITASEIHLLLLGSGFPCIDIIKVQGPIQFVVEVGHGCSGLFRLDSTNVCFIGQQYLNRVSDSLSTYRSEVVLTEPVDTQIDLVLPMDTSISIVTKDTRYEEDTLPISWVIRNRKYVYPLYIEQLRLVMQGGGQVNIMEDIIIRNLHIWFKNNDNHVDIYGNKIDTQTNFYLSPTGEGELNFFDGSVLLTHSMVDLDAWAKKLERVGYVILLHPVEAASITFKKDIILNVLCKDSFIDSDCYKCDFNLNISDVQANSVGVTNNNNALQDPIIWNITSGNITIDSRVLSCSDLRLKLNINGYSNKLHLYNLGDFLPRPLEVDVRGSACVFIKIISLFETYTSLIISPDALVESQDNLNHLFLLPGLYKNRPLYLYGGCEIIGCSGEFVLDFQQSWRLKDIGMVDISKVQVSNLNIQSPSLCLYNHQSTNSDIYFKNITFICSGMEGVIGLYGRYGMSLSFNNIHIIGEHNDTPAPYVVVCDYACSLMCIEYNNIVFKDRQHILVSDMGLNALPDMHPHRLKIVVKDVCYTEGDIDSQYKSVLFKLDSPALHEVYINGVDTIQESVLCLEATALSRGNVYIDMLGVSQTIRFSWLINNHHKSSGIISIKVAGDECVLLSPVNYIDMHKYLSVYDKAILMPNGTIGCEHPLILSGKWDIVSPFYGDVISKQLQSGSIQLLIKKDDSYHNEGFSTCNFVGEKPQLVLQDTADVTLYGCFLMGQQHDGEIVCCGNRFTLDLGNAVFERNLRITVQGSGYIYMPEENYVVVEGKVNLDALPKDMDIILGGDLRLSSEDELGWVLNSTRTCFSGNITKKWANSNYEYNIASKTCWTLSGDCKIILSDNSVLSIGDNIEIVFADITIEFRGKNIPGQFCMDMESNVVSFPNIYLSGLGDMLCGDKHVMCGGVFLKEKECRNSLYILLDNTFTMHSYQLDIIGNEIVFLGTPTYISSQFIFDLLNNRIVGHSLPLQTQVIFNIENLMINFSKYLAIINCSITAKDPLYRCSGDHGEVFITNSDSIIDFKKNFDVCGELKIYDTDKIICFVNSEKTFIQAIKNPKVTEILLNKQIGLTQHVNVDHDIILSAVCLGNQNKSTLSFNHNSQMVLFENIVCKIQPEIRLNDAKFYIKNSGQLYLPDIKQMTGNTYIYVDPSVYLFFNIEDTPVQFLVGNNMDVFKQAETIHCSNIILLPGKYEESCSLEREMHIMNHIFYKPDLYNIKVVEHSEQAGELNNATIYLQENCCWDIKNISKDKINISFTKVDFLINGGYIKLLDGVYDLSVSNCAVTIRHDLPFVNDCNPDMHGFSLKNIMLSYEPKSLTSTPIVYINQAGTGSLWKYQYTNICSNIDETPINSMMIDASCDINIELAWDSEKSYMILMGLHNRSAKILLSGQAPNAISYQTNIKSKLEYKDIFIISVHNEKGLISKKVIHVLPVNMVSNMVTLSEDYSNVNDMIIICPPGRYVLNNSIVIKNNLWFLRHHVDLDLDIRISASYSNKDLLEKSVIEFDKNVLIFKYVATGAKITFDKDIKLLCNNNILAHIERSCCNILLDMDKIEISGIWTIDVSGQGYVFLPSGLGEKLSHKGICFGVPEQLAYTPKVNILCLNTNRHEFCIGSPLILNVDKIRILGIGAKYFENDHGVCFTNSELITSGSHNIELGRKTGKGEMINIVNGHIIFDEGFCFEHNEKGFDIVIDTTEHSNVLIDICKFDECCHAKFLILDSLTKGKITIVHRDGCYQNNYCYSGATLQHIYNADMLRNALLEPDKRLLWIANDVVSRSVLVNGEKKIVSGGGPSQCIENLSCDILAADVPKDHGILKSHFSMEYLFVGTGENSDIIFCGLFDLKYLFYVCNNGVHKVDCKWLQTPYHMANICVDSNIDLNIADNFQISARCTLSNNLFENTTNVLWLPKNEHCHQHATLLLNTSTTIYGYVQHNNNKGTIIKINKEIPSPSCITNYKHFFPQFCISLRKGEELKICNIQFNLDSGAIFYCDKDHEGLLYIDNVVINAMNYALECILDISEQPHSVSMNNIIYHNYDPYGVIHSDRSIYKWAPEYESNNERTLKLSYENINIPSLVNIYFIKKCLMDSVTISAY